MNDEFNKRVVLITGATSGIGKACVDRFAGNGAHVMATGRNRDELEEIAARWNSEGRVVEIFDGDLTQDSFRITLIEETVRVYGAMHVLVNAAGIISSGTVLSTPLAEYDTMMDINLRSMFHLMQLALPSLISVKGNIVNVSSVTGKRAFPGILAYCVSKAGVDQLTRAAALELAEKGVRVNAVNPGVVKTNLHRRSGMNSDQYARFLEHSRTTHPLGRVGEPGEIADLVYFLASDRAGWITGETVSIDGGRHQTCAR